MLKRIGVQCCEIKSLLYNDLEVPVQVLVPMQDDCCANKYLYIGYPFLVARVRRLIANAGGQHGEKERVLLPQ
jgi:hypothetical protein